MNDAMDIMPIFYKSAFLSCVEDKRRGASTHSRTITTVRDHAHLLIDFIDDLLDLMFDIPLEHKSLDIATIGFYFFFICEGKIDSSLFFESTNSKLHIYILLNLMILNRIQ